MRNSKRNAGKVTMRRGRLAFRCSPCVAASGVCAALLGWASHSPAQVAAEGYAVERFSPAAPGTPWLVMDDLRLDGPLGGAVSLVTGYARRPLRVSAPGSPESLSVVSDQAFVDVGLAILYERFRFTLDIPDPMYMAGKSGLVGGNQYTAPRLDIGKYPDKVSDFRLGVDSRLWGDVDGPFRLGLSAQLFVPHGERATYVTDATYRSVLRAQFAGRWGIINHAGFVGVHLRPRDDSDTIASPSLGGPRGSEFVFGLAVAPQTAFGGNGALRAGFGPELFGETAFKEAFGKYTTALEALLSAHLTHVNEHGALVRIKLGAGPGIHPQFGAPTWRMVLGLEISDRVASGTSESDRKGSAR